MSLLRRLRALFASAPPGPLDTWFVATFDDTTVRLRAEPPGKAPWSQAFAWKSVTRVCFKAEGLHASDGIYLFTSDPAERYAVPTEARGGPELWSEIVRRGLFDPELAIRAAGSTGGLFCWPPDEPDA